MLWSRRHYNPPSSEQAPVPWKNKTAGYHAVTFSVSGPLPCEQTSWKGRYIEEAAEFVSGSPYAQWGVTQQGFIVGEDKEGYEEIVYGVGPPEQVIEHCPQQVGDNEFVDTLSNFNVQPQGGIDFNSPAGASVEAVIRRIFKCNGVPIGSFEYTSKFVRQDWTLPGLTLELPHDARIYYDAQF